MYLDLGSRVRTRDGQNAGKVKRIIFDPDRMTVREFVIREGRLFREDRIVDLALVEDIDDEHVVTLKLDADEIDELPVFIREEHMPIYGGGYDYARQIGELVRPGSIPTDAVVLSHASQVYDTTGEHIGHLDELVIAPNGAVTAFIVDTGFLFDRELEIPVEAVKTVAHRRIGLRISADQLARATVA